MQGHKHETGVSFLDDSVKHGKLIVIKPFSKGATRLEVEGLEHVDLADASEETPVCLHDEANPEGKMFVTSVVNSHAVRVLAMEESGTMRQAFLPVKADMMQPITEYQPLYRRNVRNFMPSLRFAPAQYLNCAEYSYLQRKLSGPVAQNSFVLFFVSLGYNTVGSSPWPVFTALDSKTAYFYQLHVVIEQEPGVEDSFEPRWKILFGSESAKTTGIDPTQHSIVTIAKHGRLVRLFINGCENGKAAAELVIGDDEDCTAQITEALFGMDANGAKFFDGEVSEFIAYSTALSDAQTDSVGRYLSRRFNIPWTWSPPKDTRILDEWLENKALGKIKKRDERDEQADFVDRSTYKEDVIQVQQTMRSFGIPEDTLPCLQQLTRMAKFPRKRMLIVKEQPFDKIFEYMHSKQTLLKVAAIRLLSMLCKQNREALEAVLVRDGLFLLLRACEPEWKKALQELLDEKQALYDKAALERDITKRQLDSSDKSNVAIVFQARMRLKYCDSMVEEAKQQVDGVYKRMTSGIEQMNNYELVRSAAGAIAVIVGQDDECKELLIRMHGLKVLDRVLDTPNIPVQTSICKVIWALVQQEKVATALVNEGMMQKIVGLMFLEDPPVQCEAAGIVLKTIVHKSLREPLLKFKLIEGLHNMLSSTYEDNYRGCTRVLQVLATHNDAMRVKIARNEGTILCLVKICQSPDLEIRQRASQTLGYIALTDEGADKMWDSGFTEVMMELLEEKDRAVLTHTVMAIANGSRNEAVCRSLLQLDMARVMVDIGRQPGLGHQHLVCGVLANMATVHDKKLPHLFAPQVLSFLVGALETASLHARYMAANALRRMAWQGMFVRESRGGKGSSMYCTEAVEARECKLLFCR